MADGFKDRFKKMSNEELLEIALSGDEMMPEAQSALDSELDGRNLRGELALRQAPPEMPAKRAPVLMFPDQQHPPFSALLWEPEFVDPTVVPALADEQGRDLVLIARFRDLVPAQLAQGALQSAGIDAILLDENMVRVDWLVSNAIGGIRLVVDREESAAAVEILRSPPPDKIDFKSNQ
jgi:hypothetical protein